MKKLLIIGLMLLGVVAQAQNFVISATTEASIRKNVVKGNSANYGFGMINDTLKLIGLTRVINILPTTITKATLGLGNVNNTSDLNKPISTATQTALDGKLSFVNIIVANLSDSSTVTHNLNTTKIDVSFFVSNRENNQINWHPDTNNTIKIYLPIRDKTTQKKFTGEVFITKRQ